MGRLRNTIAAAAVGAALTAANAHAAEAPPLDTIAPALEQNETLEAPEGPATTPAPSGGTDAEAAPVENPEASEPSPEAGSDGGSALAPTPSEIFEIPSIPSSSCAAQGVPPVLIPIYSRAANAYGLGPQGPSILASINGIESAFGSNMGPSSAGAVGWMQFMPSTWETYGVDANGDGVRDPYDPEDAIFAAARYLNAAGMPGDTYGAIFAYNHADWYVAEVLANASCYGMLGVGVNGLTQTPQLQAFACKPTPAWRKQIPAEYMEAFEDAAGRYELGERGVWALASVAHLESNFGRGMSNTQMRERGPLGLEPSEWKTYAVDGDEDGHIHRGDPFDSAATLARLIWSRGSLRAGIFTHNQAQWYVQAVLTDAEQLEGKCQTSYVDWRVAPLPSGLETAGPESVLNPNGLASAPQSAPAAVKAAVSAANSISTLPYVWGGGHGSWYASGYDCSGAVSFALYGAGLLDTPLTSGQLESYGEPGPGRWITIYASPTHTYAEIAGLRWDTVGDAQGTGPRWHVEPPYPEGFVVRHPPGY
ncbi:MAG TPA: lytic murein transglycosylase [Solirubrobacterales bacterium]|nr:lytic murein transglycosylase [Solirubrobacterales bacterium]